MIDRPPSARSHALPGRELAIAAAFAVVLGALAARTIVLTKLHNLPRLLETSASVLEGRPQWRAFQNRLPSSAFEYYWSRALEHVVGLDHVAGFTSYLALCTITLAFVHVLIGRHQLGTLSRAISYAAAALLATVVLQDDRWLYPWDLPEAVVFALFFLGIVARWPFAAFAALYALAVTMKETAVFMGIWLCLQSFDLRRVLPGRGIDGGMRPTDRRGIAVGLAAIVVPVVYAKLVRDALFVAQMDGRAEASLHRTLGNHLWVVSNLRAIATCEFCGSYEITVLLIVALAVAGTLYLVLRGRTLPAFSFDAGAMTVLIFLTGLAFGVVSETRTLAFGVPFFLAFGAGVLRRLNAA